LLSLIIMSLLQTYTAELNVDAALHELFAYARQYQYEVYRMFLIVLLFNNNQKVTPDG